MRVKNILHPTDFSDSAKQALRQAVRLAVAHEATLHVFHTVLLLSEDPKKTERDLEDYKNTATEEARTLLRGGHTLDLQTACDRSVSVFDAVMDRVALIQPDLLLVGTHGRSGVSKFLMGSEAEKLLRHAPCHLMTLRADATLGAADGRFTRIVVPVDFSDHSRRALDIAHDLSQGRHDAITLLHVVEPIPALYYAGGITSRFALDGDLRSRVEDKLRSWAHDAESPVLVTEGNPGAEIAKVASDLSAELIVMGTRGLTGLEHFFVGSVAERVCRHATVPVLTAK